MRGCSAKQDRVAVRCGFGDEIGAQRACRADLVLDDNRCVQLLLELVGKQSAGDVEGAARRIGNDELDDTAGIALAVGRCRENDQREK